MRYIFLNIPPHNEYPLVYAGECEADSVFEAKEKMAELRKTENCVIVRVVAEYKPDMVVLKSTPPIDEQTIANLCLPDRCNRALISGGFTTIGKLLEATQNDILRIPNCGTKVLIQVMESLSSRGLKLAGSEL